MKVERITDIKLATSILGLEDNGLQINVLTPMECSKAEWVQWIIDSIQFNDGNFLRLFAISDNNKIKGYMVATNCVVPPVSRYFIINYQAFFGLSDDDGIKYGLSALEEVKKWAIQCGCRKIFISCLNEAQTRFYQRYGFHRLPDINMLMEL